MKKAFQALKKYWMKFAHFIGNVNSKIIFTIIFFIFIGIYALIAKIIHWFARNKTKESYWEKKKYTKPTLESLGKQY